MIIISSQRHLNESIVEDKRANKDYDVIISPEFEIEGETYAVVIDGHHSLAAAKKDGTEPVYIVGNASEHHDAIGLLDSGQIDDFLDVVSMGDD